MNQSKAYNVLFVTNSAPGSMMHFLDAFHESTSLNVYVEYLYRNVMKTSFFQKVFHKLKVPLDNHHINQRILDQNKRCTPDFIFIVKGNTIYPSTLRRLKEENPNVKLVSFSNDNMALWHNKSLYYHFGVRYYDLVVSINIDGYKRIEERYKCNIIYLDKSFSRKYHYVDEIDKTIDVLFIGSYEKERYQDLQFLAEQGIRVDVFGGMWERIANDKINDNLIIHFKERVGHDYRKVISKSKITLGFLRKLNFDTQTSRTFEIPACGGFMLMERTESHQKLFKEGEEAEYFSSKEELLSKIKHYLVNDTERNRIAQNGRKRCDSSDYSYNARTADILLEIEKLITK